MSGALFYTVIVLTGLFLLFLWLEQRLPLRARTRALIPRFLLNLVVAALAFLPAHARHPPFAGAG